MLEAISFARSVTSVHLMRRAINGPSAKGSPQPALDDVGVPVLVEHQDGVCHVEVVAAPSEDDNSGHAKGSPQPAHLMRRAINGPSAADQSQSEAFRTHAINEGLNWLLVGRH